MKHLWSAFAVATLLLAAAGCHPDEGARCNPLLFTDECVGGAQCTTPASCAVSYCCPPPEKLTSKTSLNCQPCAALDAGADATPTTD